MRPRIAIFGAGAMGAVYGALLARVAEVVIIDSWRDQIAAIARDGLHVSGIEGDQRPFVTAVHSDATAPYSAWADIAVIVVNAGSTAAVAPLVGTVLKPDGYAVTLQNGIGNIEALEAVLGAGRVIPGLSYHSGAIRGLGHVAHTHRGPTWIGEIDRSKSPRILALVDLFERAGAVPELVDDVVGWVWTKFIHNCAINPVSAAAGIRVGEIPTTPGADELQTRIIEEALAVVRAKGVSLADNDPMGSIKAFCKVKFNKPSMLQHIEANRETEIEALNGALVREGKALGIPTPYNEAITWMIRAIQHHRIEAALHPDTDYDALEKRAKAEAGK